MVTRITTCSIVAIMLCPMPADAQARRRGTEATGRVESVSVTPATRGASAVEITIDGTNPCPAVLMDYGNGITETLSIGRLPTSFRYDYPEAGAYRLVARGTSQCAGQAIATLRVTEGNANAPSSSMRFRGLDRDDDGVITRTEWRGSSRSFDVHDWNGDGVLSGAEVLSGNRQGLDDPANYDPTDRTYRNWTRAGFTALDADGNARITLDEWQYVAADFWRADRNRDSQLDLGEFLAEDFDDDRGDRFDYLDVNDDGRITATEWHSSRAAFTWLDVDGNGVLTRAELDGDAPITETPAARRVVTVDPQLRWTSTRIALSPGDIVSFEATGNIQMNAARTDPATPAGRVDGRTASAAPLSREPAGALIARIDNGPAFLVGANQQGYRASNSGILYLGVNDDHLPDNSGSFTVTVTKARAGGR
jgi:Ca2+-binding EF-hand superfamily protein